MATYSKVKRVLWIILFANLAVAALKLIIGTVINSASMTADGFHSLTDGSSNIVGLIGIHWASKPVDEDHPYGHGKFETLAGLFIAGMLFFIGGKIILEAMNRFSEPVIPNVSFESLIVLLVTLCVNILVCVFEYKKGRELDSQILVSDSMHTRSDIYVSVGVLITLLGIRLGLSPIIDPIASLIVAGFIMHAGYEIFRDNSDVLVDKAVVDTEQVKEIVMNFEQVKDTHNIRSRSCGNELHIDLHIMTEPNMSVEESHTLIHNIEAQIQRDLRQNVQVIAHLEPFKTSSDVLDI